MAPSVASRTCGALQGMGSEIRANLIGEVARGYRVVENNSRAKSALITQTQQLLKLFGCAVDWKKHLGYTNSKELSNAHDLADETKKVLSSYTVITEGVAIAQAVKDAKDDKRMSVFDRVEQAVENAFYPLTRFFGGVKDCLDVYSKRIRPLSETTLAVANKLSLTALFLGKSRAVWANVKHGSYQYAGGTIDLAKNVSSVAFAALMLRKVFLGVAVQPVVALSLSTAALGFELAGRFYHHYRNQPQAQAAS